MSFTGVGASFTDRLKSVLIGCTRKRFTLGLIILLSQLFIYTVRISRNGGTTIHFVHENNDELVQEITSKKRLLGDPKNSSDPVPKIVHFTWGGKRPMRFHQMVCFISAYHILRPKRIFVWYSKHLPTGQWWEYLKRNISDFTTVVSLIKRQDPDSVHGRAVYVPEHKSDIIRLQVLLENGGIYLDLDVLVLKPFEPLLRYETTMGLEDATGLCNGIIITKKNSTFLRLWWEEYKTFNDQQWSTHSVILPFYLMERYPWMVHLERDTLHRPNWYELQYLYGDQPYDWHHNYAIHLWYRKYGVEHDFESIKTVNSTFGQIFRFVLFGNPNLL